MNHKKQLIKVLWSTDHGFPQLVLIGEEQCLFKHVEADVNIIRYLLLLQDNKSHIQITAKIQTFSSFYFIIPKVISMRWHDGRVININETVRNLGNVCKDILPMHALTRCDMVSYPYGKGKSQQLICF